MPVQPRIMPASHLRTELAPDFSQFKFRLLAQGDSWFSINGLSLFTASSILMRMRFADSNLVVNCADPGDTLVHMVDWRRDPYFFGYFAGGDGKEYQWDALLLSAGGNDLIDALSVGPLDGNAVPRTRRERLLLTEEERTGGVGMERYVSQAGWEVFRFHMLAQYQALDEMRARSRHNRETPIFTHCYSYAMPRNVGAGLGVGPWLYPSLKAYGVPESDWLPLASHFIDLLHDDVIAATEIGGLHILDTRMLIPPASSNPDVADPLWLNEIHPTASGYDLIAPAFVSLIESVLG